ncbi:MAG TPA: zinc-dependent alcohol dehydrogenase family protein [Xanthomonadaceae bacterium]|nr:zinc-dependent alcohol dehydrogenase family protein [Xanthomonadaceae bacterium]
MTAMVLERPGLPLAATTRPLPAPSAGEVRLRIEACGVCRTDLHIADGELPQAVYPVVPGHEIVARVEALGAGVRAPAIGERVGVPWLAQACGHCGYCREGRENLCDDARFTGCSRDGGFATHVLAEADFCIRLDALAADAVHVAPLLCAGLIGWRALRAAGPVERLGLYGFGASAHLVAQLARSRGTAVHAFTRPGDDATQAFARGLGACWAGGSDEPPPRPLAAAILFAPVGELVPVALRAVRKGGRVVCAGIHMSDIPRFPYRLLWEERQLLSAANLTRADAAGFLPAAAAAGVVARVRPYPLAQANAALDDLRHGRLEGAAVLLP